MVPQSHYYEFDYFELVVVGISLSMIANHFEFQCQSKQMMLLSTEICPFDEILQRGTHCIQFSSLKNLAPFHHTYLHTSICLWKHGIVKEGSIHSLCIVGYMNQSSLLQVLLFPQFCMGRSHLLSNKIIILKRV